MTSRLCARVAAGVAVVAFWAIATGFGLSRLWVYDSTPGEGAEPRGAWPAAAPVPRPTGCLALLVFAHPRCPCSRVTLDELEYLLDRAPGRAEVHVFFFAPPGSAPGWERTGLWDRAAALAGACPHRDEGGRYARLFGARTSGQVFLYSAEGRLAFSGGITAGRGHGGENTGRASVLALLTGAGGVASEAPTYGCPLRDPGGEEGGD